MPALKPWSPAKVEAFEGLRRLVDERAALERDRVQAAGGLQWKPVKGREYLVHWFTDPETGRRLFKSKGPRSSETEAFFTEFMDRRAEIAKAEAALDERATVQRAVAKSLKVGRMPAASGDVLRAIAGSTLADRVVLAGSTAMHAYEAQARAVAWEPARSFDVSVDLDSSSRTT